MDVIIPNLGDIDEVEVIELCVAVGDAVKVDDALVVIESDKASMEVPSTVAGIVESLQVAVGDQVIEGQLIAVVQDSATTESDAETPELKPAETLPGDTNAVSAEETEVSAEETEVSAEATEVSAESTEVEVLVPDIGDAEGVVVIEVAVNAGDDIHIGDLLVVLESEKASMEIAAEHAGTVLAVAVQVDQEVEQGTHIATLRVAGDAPEHESPVPPSNKEPIAAAAKPLPNATPPGPVPIPVPIKEEAAAAAAKVYAGPAVRRLARELGVQLDGIEGTGNRQRITKDDVKAFVKTHMQNQPVAGGGAGLPAVAVLDYAKFGPVESNELTRIQQRGAENLHRSWINLPHVTQHDEADVSDLEAFRQSLKPEAEKRGTKVTPLAFLVKACCYALAEHPNLNASLHEDRHHLVVKQYINIGMAVDTPEGLVVPVIRDADKKNIWQLSVEIADLSEKARIKKLAMDDLQGGTFSISSLGALGGTGFTPIVNAPEVAILGVSKLQTKPVWDGTAFQPRKMLPLSLSYDHRVINGADGGRFMLTLTSVLSDIRRLTL